MPTIIKRKTLLLFLSILLLSIGGYLLILINSPKYIPPYEGSTNLESEIKVLAESVDQPDLILIPKIGVKIPIVEGNDESILEKGAWHRFPERGDPISGGNFILSAHRFNLGFTPSGTRKKSPFYNLDKLSIGDEFFVYFKKDLYKYSVKQIHTVAPSQLEIENASEEAKMTLYTCTLKGESDGRLVVEAKLDDSL